MQPCRKDTKAKEREHAGGQLTAFLTSLFKAIESTPNAAVVYTLAIGKGGKATDAYSVTGNSVASFRARWVAAQNAVLGSTVSPAR
jgi:hypothetical protein